MSSRSRCNNDESNSTAMSDIEQVDDERHEKMTRQEAIRAYYGDAAILNRSSYTTSCCSGGMSSGDDDDDGGGGEDIVGQLLSTTSTTEPNNKKSPFKNAVGASSGGVLEQTTRNGTNDEYPQSLLWGTEAGLAPKKPSSERDQLLVLDKKNSILTDGWDDNDDDSLSDDEDGHNNNAGALLVNQLVVSPTTELLSRSTASPRSPPDTTTLVMGKIGGRYSQNEDDLGATARSDWYDEDFLDEDEEDDNDVAAAASAATALKNSNCFGVVHVKLLKGRKLPCPVHTNVQAVLRLHPWKGCVRLDRVVSSYASGSGVTADWSVQEVAVMVHAYSEGSPFPSLQIELFMITPLFLEFKMATLTISCEKLLAEPGQIFRQWLTTDKDPELLLEAWFERPIMAADLHEVPADDDQEMSPLSRNGSAVFFDDVALLVDKSEHQQQTMFHYSTRSFDNESATVGSTLTPATKYHLFHTVTYRSVPAACCVCRRSLFWSSGTQQCEVCQLDCCPDCLLSVDVRLPCGSEVARTAVVQAIQNKWTLDRLMDVVAPTTQKSSSSNNNNNKKKMALPSSPVVVGSDGSGTIGPASAGIGVLRLEISKVFVLMESLPPETDPVEVVALKQQLRPGDYYVRVGNQRTRTIQQSKGLLNFESHLCEFVLLHYGEEFKVELIEANSDSVVGTGLISAQMILQQQRDYLVETQPFLSFIKPLHFDQMRSTTVELRYFSGRLTNTLDYYDPQKKSSTDNDDAARPGDIVGCMSANVCLEENYTNLFSLHPYNVPDRPDEELNMAIFQQHLSR
jgi:hypothetical protein